MNPREVDAAVVVATVTVAAGLGGLWFWLLSPVPALVVTLLTSLGLGTGNVLLRDHVIMVDEREEVDDERPA